ncbi:MAG: four helix bundle protein [Bacteroidales bacterium]|nr:four helix bundle protein [Candidatus Sodaliphilus aphodohippi]
MRDYKHLEIWQRGINLTIQIYDLTKEFPSEERFGLTSQLRRAVSSIPINIAEGCGRDTLKDFAHFLQIALGSLFEVESELIIAQKLGYVRTGTEVLATEITELKKMIDSYKTKLQRI